jgi:hypothetical protein
MVSLNRETQTNSHKTAPSCPVIAKRHPSRETKSSAQFADTGVKTGKITLGITVVQLLKQRCSGIIMPLAGKSVRASLTIKPQN